MITITFTPTVIGWNNQYKVVVDQMGLPVPHSTLVDMLQMALKHLEHSNLEVEAIAKRLTEDNTPSMVDQLDWEFFTRGFGDSNGMSSIQQMMKDGTL